MGNKWTFEYAESEPGPILHPLAGARLSVYAKRAFCTAGLSPRSRMQRLVSFGAQVARIPFAAYESIRWARDIANEKLEKPPIFLVGHWRSGTTHLHNLMSRDPQFGYITFAETAMPLDMLGKKVEIGQAIIKKNLPETRGYDNVKLDVFEPQEEEMAIGNLNSIGYYNVYYFPELMEEEQQKALFLKGATDAQIKKFEASYDFLLRKVSYAKGGKQLLFKNPASTARIPMLKRLFPNAKFIHIVRNPWPVFSSSMGKFPRLLNAFAWQDFDKSKYADFTIRNYKELMQRYISDRDSLGLAENELVETSYEKITADPLGEISRIYDQLEIPNKDVGLAPISKYLDSLSGYRRNVHHISEENAEKIRDEWKFAFDEWGYPVEPPEDIAIG